MSSRHFGLGLALLTLVFIAERPALADDGPLAPFAKFIGTWELEQSVQVIEWGVGKMSVKATSFAVTDGTRKPVSEGYWFWHPGSKQIKGYFTAIDMPIAFFDYTTRFEGKRMVSQLEAYTQTGAKQVYEEVWDAKDDAYVWSLLQDNKKIMSGTFQRVVTK